MLPCWGAGTWRCFCTPLRTQDCTVPEQLPTAAQHSRLSMRPPDISEWFPVIKYTYHTHAESNYTCSSDGDREFFFSPPSFFLVKSEQRAHLEIPLLNSSTEKRKFGLELVCWAIVSAFILLSSKLKCVSTRICTEKSLCCFGHLRELGTLSSNLTIKRFWWNVSILILFLHPPKTKVKRCFTQMFKILEEKKKLHEPLWASDVC